jgi:hypothetical protein
MILAERDLVVRATPVQRFAERFYLIVLPTANCALEVTDVVLGAAASALARLPPPQPPPPTDMSNTVSASAPAAGLRDLEVMCIRILFFLSSNSSSPACSGEVQE